MLSVLLKYAIEHLGLHQLQELARNLPRRIQQAAMMKEIYQRGPIACGIDAGPLLKLGHWISSDLGSRHSKYFQKRHVELMQKPCEQLMISVLPRKDLYFVNLRALKS